MKEVYTKWSEINNDLDCKWINARGIQAQSLATIKRYFQCSKTNNIYQGNLKHNDCIIAFYTVWMKCDDQQLFEKQLYGSILMSLCKNLEEKVTILMRGFGMNQ